MASLGLSSVASHWSLSILRRTATAHASASIRAAKVCGAFPPNVSRHQTRCTPNHGSQTAAEFRRRGTPHRGHPYADTRIPARRRGIDDGQIEAPGISVDGLNWENGSSETMRRLADVLVAGC